jgi:hypothetical protein
MFGLPTLDLVIGLVFIYFLLSLVCATVQEIIANLKDQRFKVLEMWLLKQFHKDGFGRDILNHAVIRGLSLSGRPSYIPSSKFAQVVLDMVHSQVHGDRPFEINSLRDGIEKSFLLPPALKRFLLQSIIEAKGEVANVRSDLAKWFDESMERVGGYYKKWTQKIIIVIALIVVAIFNADSIQIARYLYDHPAEVKLLADRAAQVVNDQSYLKLVEEARHSANDSTRKSAEAALQAIRENVQQLRQLAATVYNTQLPLGWEAALPQSPLGWITKIIGLLFTVLAVSLGAPFWFEVLNKLVNLRNAGRKPQPENPAA